MAFFWTFIPLPTAYALTALRLIPGDPLFPIGGILNRVLIALAFGWVTITAAPSFGTREPAPASAGSLQRRANGPAGHLQSTSAAELAATLFAEELIDEIVLKVNPVLFGSGIPLFSRS